MPVISTNTAANSAVRYLNINSQQMSSSLSKLSSGSKITQASDDAAGLAIATRISSDVTTLQQAATNASQATSILQTADGGASNISDILARMKSLASQSSSGTVTDSSRAYLNSEFTALSDQINSIATGTRYSGQSLLDGPVQRGRRLDSGRIVVRGYHHRHAQRPDGHHAGCRYAQYQHAGRCDHSDRRPRHCHRHRIGRACNDRRPGVALQLQRKLDLDPVTEPAGRQLGHSRRRHRCRAGQTLIRAGQGASRGRR